MTSQAAAIRDAIIARLHATQRFVRIQPAPQPQFQPEDMPAAAIWIFREDMLPEGDGNAGALRFVIDVTIAISVLRGWKVAAETGDDLDADVAAIEAALFTDPTFVNFGSDALFESVERIERQRLFSMEGDTYYGELRTTIQFRTRIEFEPVIPDAYAGATVTVRPIQNPGAPPISAVWDEPAEG